MDVTFETLHGLCFGIEYLAKDESELDSESAIAIHFAIFRLMIWLGDNE